MKEKEKILETFLSTIINTLNAEEIYDASQNAILDLLHPDGFLMMYNTQTSHVYHIIRQWGDISCEKKYCVPNDSLIEQLLLSEPLIHTNDTAFEKIRSTMTYRKRKWITEQDISCFYTIKYNHAVIGFIFISRKEQPVLLDIEQDYLRKICSYTSYALRNANLYQKAYRSSVTDDLTSLYNRKHAFECIDNCCAEHRSACLIVLDIDDFKLYNELYGAKEGDNLIHRCAQIILQKLSTKDMGFRYGADEFLILKDGGNISSAKELANSIIQSIVSENPADTVWDVTITCGISAFPSISSSASSFLHNAEQAVYYGKLEGKGYLSVYRQGMEERSQNPDIQAAYDRVAPTIYALTAAIDAKDSYTFVHSMNVSRYAVILAEAVGMNPNDIEIIRDAGMLHDIGKISIPEHILKKTDTLTPDEYEIMKTHVENSTKMIRYLPDMDYVIPAVLGHHERYDGKGYPRGLAGDDIPLMARILTIADCFDAMTARRPYKQPQPISYAIAQLQDNCGTQFDPALVSLFISLIYEGSISL